MERNDQNKASNKRDNFLLKYGGIIFGILCLTTASLFAYFESEKQAYSYIFIGLFYFLGFQLIITHFKKHFLGFYLTRILYYTFQVIFAIVFILATAFSLLGKVLIAIIVVFSFSTLFLLKSLELLDVENHFEISLFLSFTFIAIIFSFKGNAIVNWLARKTDSSDKERLDSDLKIINKYLGQSQIRFFIYCLYFICIITFTVINLSNPDPNTKQNTYLVIQSFGALVAFDRILNNTKIMEPWVSKIKMIPGAWKEIRKTPLKEIFKEEEEETESQK